MSVTYKIGEAASLLHLKTYVLRFWETEFPQIAPLRTEKGQRLYTEEHLALLDRIRFLLHEHGLTIEGARKVLSEEAGRGVRYARPGLPPPAPAGAREDPGGSGRRTETPPADGAGASPLRFPAPALHVGGNLQAQAAVPPAPQIRSRTPVKIPSREIPISPIRPGKEGTGGRTSLVVPIRTKAALGQNPGPASPAGPLPAEGGKDPRAVDQGTNPARLSPKEERPPLSRRDGGLRRDILEELEAVASLLRGAPSGKSQ
jgi:hypothetical protein